MIILQCNYYGEQDSKSDQWMSLLPRYGQSLPHKECAT